MNLKRSLFAFLVMVFILSGCMADVNVSSKRTLQAPSDITQSNSTTVPVDAVQTAGVMINTLSFRNQKVDANGQIKSTLDATSLSSAITNYTGAKYGKVTLLSQEGAISSISAKRNAVIVEAKAAEAKRKEAEAKKKAEEARQKALASSADKNSSLQVAGNNDAMVFYPRTTLYGVDCYGCGGSNGNGRTATGIELSVSNGVKQSDGSWVPGITYDGYYIIAADRSIPLYSIVELSNHGLSGMGFSPDQPIKAIVVDRGGGISGAHIDLYVGSEGFINTQVWQNGSTPQATVLRYGR